MEALTKEIGIKIAFKDMDVIFGRMAGFTKGSGKIIKCMGKVHLKDLMVEIIRETF